MNLLIYVVSLFSLSLSAIVAVDTAEPTVYFSHVNEGWQVARAVCECLSVAFVFATFCKEMVQLARHRLDYAKDLFNYIDVGACLLLLTVVPLRFTHKNEQWFFFAFGYLLWAIRISKFAAVYRQTGVYVQVLAKILKFDFVQFGIMFLVVLVAFSGAFYLAMRGNDNLFKRHETRHWWCILWVGARSLVEGQPAVDYAGEEGYGFWSQFIMFCYLVTCIVVLLNILIAQLADSYQKIQQDVQRELEASRACIVARVELHTMWCTKNWRKDNYKDSVEVLEHNALEKWDCPPLKEMNKHVQDMFTSIDNHKANLKAIKHRLMRQEHSLLQIQDKLTTLIGLYNMPRPSLNESANDSNQSAESERIIRIIK